MSLLSSILNLIDAAIEAREAAQNEGRLDDEAGYSSVEVRAGDCITQELDAWIKDVPIPPSGIVPDTRR